MLSTNGHSTAATGVSEDRVVALSDGVEIPGSDLVTEVVTITPTIASQWLKANTMNRPVRRNHVKYLADEITKGNWELNGEAIIIAENEAIMNGQHRLMAVIDSGKSIRSLVVYGVDPEAFSTIDTGVVRSSGDAIYLNFNDMPLKIVQAVASGAQWCMRLENGNTYRKDRISNTSTLEYVRKHHSLFTHAETLSSYPKDARPIPLGMGTGLYEMFTRKKELLADDFMRKLFTGENITRGDVEWLLRNTFQRDSTKNSKYPSQIKVRMVIKGWNWRRRGMAEASIQTITIRADDEQRVRIL